MFNRCVIRPLLLLGLILVLSAVQAAVHAGGWPRFGLPIGTVKNKSGLHITVDADGLEGNGYRPVRVEVTTVNAKPLLADRQIRVVIKPRSYNTAKCPEVSQVIELPEGSAKVIATVAVPQTSVWWGMAFETYEGGRKWEELSARNMGWVGGRNGWEWTEDSPAMLFIDPDVPPHVARDSAVTSFQTTGADPTPTYDLPDVRALVWLFYDPSNGTAVATGAPVPPLNTTTKVSDIALLSQLANLNRVEMLPPAGLPSRWIEFSQYDLVVISYDDLKLLAEKHPPQLAAIRDWLLGGPLLMVYGAGDNYDNLAEIEKLLDLSDLPADDDGPPEHRGWESPDKANAGDLKAALQSSVRVARGRMAAPVRRPVAKSKKPAVSAATAQQQAGTPDSAGADTPFLTRPAGLGCVVAVARSNPFPGLSSDWSWVFNSVADNHWRWYQRHGFSLHRTNDDYWKFLIPGIGRAPIWAFLVLVTLFGVVIGPVNYAFLNRARRLYLLLLTVPAGALAVTLALFTYAVATDGFGVRLRSRSFTELDQRNGKAAAWSWQSYYAAITPSQGLVFPEDATIFPIFYEPGRRNSGENDSTLDWQDAQYLRSGFLASRTATQFIVQRVTKTEARLIVRESKMAGQPPQVENGLQTTLRYLVVCDSRGDCYSAQSLAPEAKATLVKLDSAAAEKELARMAAEVAPAAPENEEKIHNTIASVLLPQRNNWMNVDVSSSDPAMSASVLESNIAGAMSAAGKGSLSPKTYVAVIEKSPVVPIGVPHASEEASLHVIRGHYE